MNTLLDALADHAEKVIDLGINLTVALLIWYLTNLSRDRADRRQDLATLQAQADALIVAVADVRAAADINQRLWEQPREQLRFIALTVFAAAGAGSRARLAGGSEWQTFAAAAGEAARFGHREVHASKLALAELRGPLARVATAAAPLMRHPDERITDAVDEVMAAVGDIGNTRRLEAFLEAFGRAVAAVTQPRPSWWARLRGRTS